MTRPGLSLRYPKEQPIIASASGFNRRQMDETGLGTVQTPKRVITVKGKRSVAEITSAKTRRTLISIVCACNVTPQLYSFIPYRG